jgi:predicted HAD superfamily phosphohydrolase
MIRFQLDVPEEQANVLETLMRETKTATKKELFNNALTLFEWAVKAKRAGRIIASIDEATGSAKELVMPALENVPGPVVAAGSRK